MWAARLRAAAAFSGFAALTASGCSDPAKATPQAAFSATFYGSNCAAVVDPGPTIGIGTASATQQATIADGTDGTRVSCSTVAIANGYATRVEITRGTTSMTFDSDVVQGKTTEARSITLRGPNTAGSKYVPSVGSPCTVTWVNGAAGRIWAGFTCSKMEGPSGLNPSVCGINEGWVIAENCDQ